MKYSVVFEKDADKQLQKIDPTQQRLIVNWISKNLEDTENPKVYGKVLKWGFEEYWRYRVGDYRLIADIQDDKILIIIVKVGYRKNYDRLKATIQLISELNEGEQSGIDEGWIPAKKAKDILMR